MSNETILADIKSAFKTFEDIGNVSSTKAKQEILASEPSNDVMKSLLVGAYSPFLQFNIKKIPVSIKACQSTEIHAEMYQKFLNLLVQFNKRELTGNAAIDAYASFLQECCPEEYTWYTRVIDKDLKIGMADKGINKVFKGLIPVYEVLLADKIPAEDLNLDTSKALKMLPEHIVTQYKIDGYRLNIHVTDSGDVMIRTRNGKVVSGYTDLETEAKEKLPRGYVYDGEVVAPELFDWISENTKQQGGVTANRDLFAEVMSHAFSKEENKQGIFNMFDMIPLSEWNSQKPTESLQVRTERILKQVKPLDLHHIVIVPTSRVYCKNNPQDLKEIVETFHQFLDIGWEGLMIKNWDAKYEFKRSKNLLKMKLMDYLDLPVTDIFEGTGKYSGMLGGVYVDYKGYQVGVGSGWSDEQRAYYWKNPNEIIGKTIEVAYQAETKNKTGGISLSFPVVKHIRYDK